MSRYILWNHEDTVITPSGEVFTAAQWEDRYPATKVGVDYVMSGGAINGAEMTDYDTFKQVYESMGCDFSDCTTKQDVLDKVEVWMVEEAERQRQAAEEAAEKSTAEERIAAALEFQNLLALDDVNLDDPEEE